MKKLIIAMTAAWAGAYIAQAADGTISYIDFEGLTAGDALNVTFDDNGGTSDSKFWSVEGYDDVGTPPEVGVISNHVEGVTLPSRPEEVASDPNAKYLAVDTEKKLFRNIKADRTGTEIGDAGLFVDTLVQFTATETAPTPDSADKLIVWLQAIDADDTVEPAIVGSTNLVVTAATLNEELTPTKTDFVIKNVSIEPNSWHRLTIKTKLVAEGSGEETVDVPEFEVYVDETKLSTSAEEGAGQTLFPSLVKYNANGSKTLTALAVEGTGAIDDIVFTTKAPSFAQDVVVEYFDVALTIDDQSEMGGFDTGTYAFDGGTATSFGSMGANIKGVVGAKSLVVTVVAYNDTVVVGATKKGTATIEETDDAFVWEITADCSAIAKDETLNLTIVVADAGAPIVTPLTNKMITLDPTTAVYAEGLSFPTVTVAASGVPLTVGKDYTTSWSVATITGPGEYTVTVTAIEGSNYSGSATATFTVTAAQTEGKAKVGETEYESGDAFVAAATSGTQNTLPTGWKVEGNVVKDAKGDTFATFPSYYNVTLADGVLTLELNANAKTTVAIDTTAETPMAVDAEAGVTLAVTVTNEKLYYALASSATLAGTYEAPAAEKFVKGNGGKLSLNAAKTGATRFYKILVTDVVPAAK